jgi:copper transport protein
VVSLDGHPLGGTLVFSVGAPSPQPLRAAQGAVDSSVAAAMWVLKVVLYAGLFSAPCEGAVSQWGDSPTR